MLPPVSVADVPDSKIWSKLWKTMLPATSEELFPLDTLKVGASENPSPVISCTVLPRAVTEPDTSEFGDPNFTSPLLRLSLEPACIRRLPPVDSELNPLPRTTPPPDDEEAPA